MISDTSEEAIWTLADAITEGDEAKTLTVAEQLVSQGEALPRIIYSVAPRLRQALAAAREIEAGKAAASEVASGLSMHPYAAKMLVAARARAARPPTSTSRSAPSRTSSSGRAGGSDYTEAVALTLALRRAVGAAGEDALAAA